MSPLLVVGLLAVQCQMNGHVNRAGSLLHKFTARGVFKPVLLQPRYQRFNWHLPLHALP